MEGRAARRQGRGDVRDRAAANPGGLDLTTEPHNLAAPVPRRDGHRRLPAPARARRRRGGRRGLRRCGGWNAGSARRRPRSRSASARTSCTRSSTSTGSSSPSPRRRSSCSGRSIGLGARRRHASRGRLRRSPGSRGLGVLYSLVAPYASARLVDSAYSAARRGPVGGGALGRPRGPPAQPARDRSAAMRSATPRRPGATRRPRSATTAQAVDLQPENSSTWYALGSYEFFTGRYKRRRSTTSTARTASIPYGPAGRPGGLLDQARAKVLAGRASARAEDLDQLRALELGGRHPVERRDHAQVQVVLEPQRLRAEARAVHDDRARVAGLRARCRHRAPGSRAPARARRQRGGALDAVAVQDEHLRLRARELGAAWARKVRVAFGFDGRRLRA